MTSISQSPSHQPPKLTRQTSFNIASCSKLITAYALRLALKRAGLGWDTLVREVIPSFGMIDINGKSNNNSNSNSKSQSGTTNNQISNECTMRDLISHRSGIGGWHIAHGPHLVNGDIVSLAIALLNPSPGYLDSPQSASYVPMTRVHMLTVFQVDIDKHLPPAGPFRQGYHYASMPFHLAGRVIEELELRWVAQSEIHGEGESKGSKGESTKDEGEGEYESHRDDDQVNTAQDFKDAGITQSMTHHVPRTFTQFVQEEIFDPLQLDAKYHPKDLDHPIQGFYEFITLHGGSGLTAVPFGLGLEKGASFASGGVWMNARDMVRFSSCF